VDLSTALDMGREALFFALTLAMPVLGVGLVVGLTISIFQAVTQIQETTLTFVPKIAGMAIAAVFFVPWIASRLLEYAERLLGEPPW